MEEKKDIFDHLKVVKTELPEDAYFENMANSILHAQKVETKSAPIVPLYKKPVFWIGSVAAVLILSFVVIRFSDDSVSELSDPLLALNDVSSEELYNYIDKNIDDFDTDLIVEVLAEDKINEMNYVEPEEDEIISIQSQPMTDESPILLDDIDAEDILDYFNTEGINSDDFEDDDIFI